MKITDIRTVPFVLPYEKPFEMATGVITEAAHVLIAVDTDDGVTGYAEAVSRPMIYGESQRSIVSAIEEWFRPALVGSDPLQIEAAQKALRAVAANETTKGALDIALHDIMAKSLGMPVWRLLGASSPSLRITRMLSMGSPEEVAAEAEDAASSLGVSSFKIKVDADVELGSRVVHAVRRAVGEEATIYVDANQSLAAETAIRFARMVEDARLTYFEEPVPATDFSGRSRLAGSTSVPILVDESSRTVEEAGLQFVHGSARAVSIKTARTGYTESRRILGLVRGLHGRAVIGSQGDSAIGAITSASLGAADSMTSGEPAELDYFLGLTDQIVTEPPSIRDGRMEINQTVPGTGVDIDADKLAFYRNDR